MKYSATSVILPELDVPETCALLQELGYDGCDLAESILDIPQFISDLNAVGYSGFISIEDFRAMEPRERLKRQLDYLKSLE
ncbi:MAG TPA: hypothetical protein PLD73_11300 [Candidatus Hydrogenedentes bacterium]|jgi:sugar phosphate isomerase/epimerase|nr:hypothetical protein [Candidatus Hydrogenedentota bacterium]HPJ98874.1 hypothetical protein [Candidatus Hydrogenedentota bacterium]